MTRQTILFGMLGAALAAALVLFASGVNRTVASAAVDASGSGFPPRTPVLLEPKTLRPSTRAEADPPPTAGDGLGLEEDELAPRSAARSSPAARIEALATAGFGRTRAEEIVSREAELRRASAFRQYAATGTVSALTGAAQSESEESLRAELGDGDFERYLAALGRSTHVAVAGVAAESAAANAGLIAGDEIRAYGGRRVFNLRELNELAQRRALGDTVAIAVIRDGVPIQLYATGGPLGLTPAVH